jgi:acyl-coenzyme A thioesterase PaaI-like protein
MKTVLNNPFQGLEGYNCFGCSPDNSLGLQMKFEMSGEEVHCRWQPKKHLESWRNVLHGGIQTTLMDEIASWWIFVNMKTSGVTYKMEVSLKKPVNTDKGSILLIARKHEVKRNLAVVFVQLFDSGGACCAESYMHYFTYPETIAKEKLQYPGYEGFIES